MDGQPSAYVQPKTVSSTARLPRYPKLKGCRNQSPPLSWLWFLQRGQRVAGARAMRKSPLSGFAPCARAARSSAFKLCRCFSQAPAIFLGNMWHPPPWLHSRWPRSPSLCVTPWGARPKPLKVCFGFCTVAALGRGLAPCGSARCLVLAHAPGLPGHRRSNFDPERVTLPV